MPLRLCCALHKKNASGAGRGKSMDTKADIRFICSEVTAVLRYAESKHGVFIAFNGVALFNCMGLLRSSALEAFYDKSVLLCVMALLMCAMLISMYSFLPQLLKERTTSVPRGKSNLLFFEHIKDHTVDSYIHTLCAEYGAEACALQRLERDIIAQIIVNARLSSRKFHLFRTAAYFDLAGITSGLLGFVLRFAQG